MEQFKFFILKVKVICNYTWKSLNTKLCSFYGGTFQGVKFHNLAMILEFISRRNVLMLNIFMYFGINSNDF